jgi:c-di-GMP-binding flagellar brake protein YcgR
MGVEFVEIRDADREKVIGFIFKSQRKMLKKGWSTT